MRGPNDMDELVARHLRDDDLALVSRIKDALRSGGKTDQSVADILSQVREVSLDGLERLQEAFPSARILSWKDKFSVRLKAMAHERQLIVVVMSLIIIVFGFGILAIQWSFVSEKINDIGVLRSLGFSSSQVFMIFLGVSWLIGLLGVLLGTGMGLLLCCNLNEILNIIGVNIFPKDVYYHDGLPVLIDESDLIFISLFSMLVTSIAGFIPALKAMRVQPIRAITSD